MITINIIIDETTKIDPTTIPEIEHPFIPCSLIIMLPENCG